LVGGWGCFLSLLRIEKGDSFLVAGLCLFFFPDAGLRPVFSFFGKEMDFFFFTESDAPFFPTMDRGSFLSVMEIEFLPLDGAVL